eukprot:1160136-Pelagomonas_calceolata.AAC.10
MVEKDGGKGWWDTRWFGLNVMVRVARDVLHVTGCTWARKCGKCVVKQKCQHSHGPKGDLDLSMRGGIMGTGDAPCNGGSESKGGRAVGGAHAALQAAVAADGTGGDAGAGGQQEPVVPSLSRPISLNLGRRQQQQQLEQQQQRQHMQQQQQQQQQQPIACAACRDGHWQQQQQHSCPRTTASGGLGSGPILSSSGMSMGLGFPWGVGDTRSREGGEAGGSLAQTQANTSVPLLGAAPGATAHDSHWGPSSSCGSLYGLSNSNMLLAMPPLQQEQQQQPNSDGNLPQQEHHVVHVGPEQVGGHLASVLETVGFVAFWLPELLCLQHLSRSTMSGMPSDCSELATKLLCKKYSSRSTMSSMGGACAGTGGIQCLYQGSSGCSVLSTPKGAPLETPQQEHHVVHGGPRRAIKAHMHFVWKHCALGVPAAQELCMVE